MAENAFKADWPSFALGFNTGKSKGGGGVELNIAYGDTPPEDTTKLWVKTSEPSGVLVSPEVEETEVDGESFTALPNPLPSKLSYAGCGAVGTKIYIIGGTTVSGTSTTGSKSVIIFDTETQEYEVLEGVLGTAIAGISCAVVGTRIYFFGGGSSIAANSNLIRYFDTETRKLVTCTAQMPTTAYGFTCASMGDEIYVFGGRASGTKSPVYKFDTNTETLTPLVENTVTTTHATCVRVGDEFYILGDSGGAGNFRFDSVTLAMQQDTVVKGAIGVRAAVIGNVIYKVGGRTGSSITGYDIENNSSISFDFKLPDYCAWSAVTATENKLYIFGGSNGNTSNNPLDFAYVFSLTNTVPSIGEGSLYVKPKVDGNVWSVVRVGGMSVEIGVDSVYKGNAEGIGEPVEAALYNGNEWTTI